MKSAWFVFGALLGGITSIEAIPVVDESFPYVGPAVPIGDLVDQTINGNGHGFLRITEPPAVTPKDANPTNNINVISTAYTPHGINIHFQTPFGIGGDPVVYYGVHPMNLNHKAVGSTHTYDRTPPCSLVNTTQCSQFFHEVQLHHLTSGKEYFYQIPGGNGTTESEVLSFKAARKAGEKGNFTVAIVNDLGYTNANGTHTYLLDAIEDGIAFVWHGGDLSYADDWYEGLLSCDLNVTDSENYWPVCYNGSSSSLPGGITSEYNTSLPAGEMPSQGGPHGGDISVIYESNWDLWQQWMSKITKKVPYMVSTGNHDASCAEFDGPHNELTAYLVLNGTNGTTAPESLLNYYSCPPSQRNFTTFQHRFRMPGEETGGISNFWYSHDYGLVHFITFNGETDYPLPGEYPFALDLSGNETTPTASETYITDSGPFGYVNGSYADVENYEQYQWLKKDLAAVDRKKTPFVIAMSHRPMYSSSYSSNQKHMRAAFEDLFLEYGADVYLSGHEHWYERLYPISRNGTIDHDAVVDDNTYLSNNRSMLHIINGQGGNIESHSTLSTGEPVLPLTAFLNQDTYGFTKLTVYNETTVRFDFIQATNGTSGDHVVLIKQ